MTERPFFADTCALFAGQLEPQKADDDIELDLLHFTSASSAKTKRTIPQIMDSLKQRVELLDSQAPRVTIIRTKEDLASLDGTQTGVVMGIQAPPEDRLPTCDDLKELHRLGVRFTCLAYDHKNRFGGGFAEPHISLTSEGKQFLNNCAQTGITVDLSHAGHQTAFDALDHVCLRQLPPLVATHTACFDLYPHRRNLPDTALAGISKQGGIVGIVSLTSYLQAAKTERDGTNDFYQHLDAAATACRGASHVCIGSDGYYTKRDEKAWRQMHEKLLGQLDPSNKDFQVRWPDQPLVWNRPDRMALVLDGLRQRYVEHDVRNIIGKNFRRFLERHVFTA